MIRSLRAGSLFGVDILIHPTFLLVFLCAFLYWGIGEHGGFAPFLWGIILAVFVYVSAVIHEFGHYFMAKQYGAEVREIELFPVLGVSRIDQLPMSPRKEGMIAGAGPILSFGLFVALLPIVVILALLLGTDRVLNEQMFLRPTPSSIISTTAMFNLGLMFASLLPAFPLDGGRMLRAAMTPRFGRMRATIIAAQCGYGVAFALVLVGVLTRNYLLPIFAVAIIWSAYTEARSVHVEARMKSITVGQYALWDMGGVSPEQPLALAFRGGTRDVAVTVRGRVVGMLWKDTATARLEGGIPGRTVGDVMDTDFYVADVSDSMYDVEQVMQRVHQWSVPVTENGRYRGIFTADRYINVHRQLAPRIGDRRWGLSEEWRDAISASIRWPRRPKP